MGEMIDAQPLFPGESEMDQLQVIHNLIGPFPSQIKGLIERRRDLRNLKLKDNNKIKNGLESRYKKKISIKGIDFMKKCLDFDQSKRWSASKLLTHEFIMEDPCLSDIVDKVDLIRNNAMN